MRAAIAASSWERHSICEDFSIDQVVVLKLGDGLGFLRELTMICERRAVRLVVISDLEEHFRHSVRFSETSPLPGRTIRLPRSTGTARKPA